MANTIKLKRSSVAGKVPLTSDLDYGEVSINYTDGTLYYKDSSGAINTIGSNIGNTVVSGNITANTAGTRATFANVTTTNGIFWANGTSYSSGTGSDTTIDAFKLYANANIGTLYNANISTNANLGAFETYANSKIGTNTNSNLVVVATTTSTSTTTGALVVAGGAGISGNISGNVAYGSQLTLAGNVNTALTITSLDTIAAGKPVKTLNIAAIDGTSAGIHVKSDGTKAYILGQNNDRVSELTLSTPYDITTGSNVAQPVFCHKTLLLVE